jgi:hypothetical protein
MVTYPTLPHALENYAPQIPLGTGSRGRGGHDRSSRGQACFIGSRVGPDEIGQTRWGEGGADAAGEMDPLGRTREGAIGGRRGSGLVVLLERRAPNRQTALFIERFQRACPLSHVVTCSSGSSAVQIAVAAAGIGPGDEVITSPVTDLGTVSGVLFQQGVPVFADLGAATYNLDVAAVERSITPRTKAIIAVHLAGNPCDLDALRALADRRGLVLIEDCAQAWAKSRGRPIGTVGHIARPLMNSKHIGTGDGGVVASNDPRFGPALLKFADKGNVSARSAFFVGQDGRARGQPSDERVAGGVWRGAVGAAGGNRGEAGGARSATAGGAGRHSRSSAAGGGGG